MKRTTLIALCMLILCVSGSSQAKASDVFLKLESMSDQFDNSYNSGSVKDQLILIYIPGTNNPFEKIYNKRKAANVGADVLLVGGFKEMMKSVNYKTKKNHLQEALSMRYKAGSKILIDMDSEIAQLLSIEGYSIVTISKKNNEVLKVDDYGFDRVKFFEILKTYEKQINQ